MFFFQLISIGLLLAVGSVSAQTQTPAQYAESILIQTRPVIVNQLPAYTNLLKKFDVLIQATQAANNPLCIQKLIKDV